MTNGMQEEASKSVKSLIAEKDQFDDLMARLIATPAGAKDGIKKPRPFSGYL
jgi:hypothetical protein